MNRKNIKNILFLDIETVSCVPSYKQLNERLRPLWDKKAGFIAKNEETPEQLFQEKAAIYAEFGKVVSIGVGFFFYDQNKQLSLKVKGLSSHNEQDLLQEFSSLLTKRFNSKNLILCAHNGKEFDFPYLCRRMVVNNIKIPEPLDISGKKPWEVCHLDTLEMWKFGDKKNYTSLELLAALFNIPGSKNEMDGSMVGKHYYGTNDLSAITRYCCKDVAVTAQLYLRFKGWPTMPETQIIYIE
ncbi:3'-5' exonuclease [Cytophagaceae bacterium ABcell3]|nr:3'-5' exonuclease [Cytophagaceae bacterium ABcell3]